MIKIGGLFSRLEQRNDPQPHERIRFVFVATHSQRNQFLWSRGRSAAVAIRRS